MVIYLAKKTSVVWVFEVVIAETINNALCSQETLMLSSSIVLAAERKTSPQLTAYLKKRSQDASALATL